MGRDGRIAELKQKQWATSVILGCRPSCPLCAGLIEHGKWEITDHVAHCCKCAPLAIGCNLGNMVSNAMGAMRLHFLVAHRIVWYLIDERSTVRMTLAQLILSRQTIPADPR